MIRAGPYFSILKEVIFIKATICNAMLIELKEVLL